jgi:hypothetical protein
MAKISRVGGFTAATARGFVSPADALRARGKLGPYDIEFELVEQDDAESVTGALTGEPGTVPDGAPAPARDEPEEEESWPGNSSETSPAKPPKNDEPSKPSPRKRARSTGAPSGSTEASGTAPTGTTSGPVTGA